MLHRMSVFLEIRLLVMVLLGFSAGVPLLLIFSTLALWLNEAGLEKSMITYFSWAALGYSFKFVWAPLVDRLRLPILTRILGRRRAWLLVSQLAIIASILLMASVDPREHVLDLRMLAYGAVLLGFSSATQDIVIDAYRIESSPVNMQSILSAAYVMGYRIGMLVAGAGSLFLAAYFGSTLESYNYQAWADTYLVMAMVMGVGVATTLLMKEPDLKQAPEHYDLKGYVRFFLLFAFVVSAFVGVFVWTSEIANVVQMWLSELLGRAFLATFLVDVLRLGLALLGGYATALGLVALRIVQRKMIEETYIAPVRDFFNRYGWSAAMLLLAVVGLYRISDIVLGVVANIFYQDMGFTKVEIATVSKVFGLIATIAGGFLGGLMALRVGVFRVLLLGAVLSALTNLLFVALASAGHDLTWLYITIAMDNLSAGLASAAFIAFLSNLTNIQFTAVQYAIFSSLMTLLPKVFGGYSGTLIEQFGYETFFVITMLIGLPILWLVYKIKPYIR